MGSVAEEAQGEDTEAERASDSCEAEEELLVCVGDAGVDQRVAVTNAIEQSCKDGKREDCDGPGNGEATLDETRIGDVRGNFEEERPRRDIEWEQHDAGDELEVRNQKDRQQEGEAGVRSESVAVEQLIEEAKGDAEEIDRIETYEAAGDEVAETHPGLQSPLVGKGDDEAAEAEEEINREILIIEIEAMDEIFVVSDDDTYRRDAAERVQQVEAVVDAAGGVEPDVFSQCGSRRLLSEKRLR